MFNKEPDHEEMLSECDHCETWVYYTQINRETNYHCEECKKLDFCSCGEERSRCSFCSMPWLSRVFEKARNGFIYKFKNYS